MPFWSEQNTEPLRNFRFKLNFPNQAETLILAKKVSKPSFTVQETSHKWLNHTYYYPGRVEWNTVTCSFVDTTGDKFATKVMDIMKESGYEFATSNTALETMSKSKAAGKLGQVQIITLDAEGNAAETWTLNNVFIKDVKFGELDYESDDLTTVDIELRYDWAEITNG